MSAERNQAGQAVREEQVEEEEEDIKGKVVEVVEGKVVEREMELVRGSRIDLGRMLGQRGGRHEALQHKGYDIVLFLFLTISIYHVHSTLLFSFLVFYNRDTFITLTKFKFNSLKYDVINFFSFHRALR